MIVKPPSPPSNEYVKPYVGQFVEHLRRDGGRVGAEKVLEGLFALERPTAVTASR